MNNFVLIFHYLMLSSQEDKDAFGCDPFAVLHAPTRAESPSPALPPKKSKNPPPRPAPPKQGPARPPPPKQALTNSFADFADFDSKVKFFMNTALCHYCLNSISQNIVSPNKHLKLKWH